jgi:probable rRNA maturation factor
VPSFSFWRKHLVTLRRKIAGVTDRGMARFLGRARRAVALAGETHVLITDSAEMRRLNARFRGKRKPTDVLSFPAANGAGGGDIAISADIAGRNAVRLGHPVAKEMKILILHGLLHLAGYDHERDAGKMARKEERLRRKLGLPSSLIVRTDGGTRRRKR